MKPFFSVIKISPNPSAGDSLAVGLLLKTDNKVWLDFSKEKLNIINKFLGDSKSAVDFSLKQIQIKIESWNQEHQQNKLQLDRYVDFVEPEYYTYLNKYSNGLLQFSAPQYIDSEINKDKFESLIRIFVDKDFKGSNQIDKIKDDKKFNFINQSYDITRLTLVSKLEDKVHTNIELSSNVIPDLYFKYKMECLGKNGVITGAKVLDMDSKDDVIEKEAFHYLVLINTFKKYYNGKKSNNFYLISDEPNDVSSKKHKIWTALKREKDFTVKDSDEVNQVADDILDSNAKKFLEVVL